MGIANRIINILVLLAAIGAIVLSYMLFQKRGDMTKGREMMAQAIVDNTQLLISKESKENKANFAFTKEDFRVDKPADKLAGPLNKFKKAAVNALDVRKALAAEIVDLASIVLDEGQEDVDFIKGLDRNAFEDSFGRENVCGAISKRIGERMTRNANARKAFFESLISLTKDFKLPDLDAAQLTTKDEGIAYAKKAVENISKKGLGALEKSETLAEHIGKVSDIVKISSPSLDNDGYADALKEQREALDKHMQLFEENIREKEKLAGEVKELTAKTEELNSQIEEEKKVIAENEKKLAENAKEIQRLRDIITPKKKEVAEGEEEEDDEEKAASAAGKGNAPSNYILLKNLQAKVVFVNEKLGFVIVDLGTGTKVEIKDADGKAKQHSVQLPPNGILTVATSLNPGQAHFSGKIQLVNMGEKESVANILPTPGNKIPSVGDVVYFSSYDLESIRLANEQRLKTAQEKMEREAAAVKSTAEAAPKTAEEEEVDDLLGNKDDEADDKKADDKKADDKKADDKKAGDKKADDKKAAEDDEDDDEDDEDE